MAVLTSEARNALPDSAFACVEGSGDTKTRLYPHHNADGTIDLPHLRNALARVADTSNESCGKQHLLEHAAALKLGNRKESGLVSEMKSMPVADFDLKDDGSVLVAFAKYNEIDHGKDVIYPGSIAEGKVLPMSAYGHTSWPHRGSQLPPGRGTLKSDGDLALFDGRFFMNTTHGRDTYEVVKEMGDQQEWSFGFDVLDFDPKPKAFPGARRGLKALDVHEVSPVLLGEGKTTFTAAIKGIGDEDELLAGSFSEAADRVLVALKDLHLREEDIVNLRLKEGRAISSERRRRLEEQLAILQELVAGHTSLLAETEPKPRTEDGTHEMDGKARLAFARAQFSEEIIRRGYGHALTPD